MKRPRFDEMNVADPIIAAVLLARVLFAAGDRLKKGLS